MWVLNMATSPVITEALTWLEETDSRRLEQLWERADRVRRAEVGEEVHLRGCSRSAITAIVHVFTAVCGCRTNGCRDIGWLATS